MKTKKSIRSIFPAIVIAFAVTTTYLSVDAATVSHSLPADTSKMAKDKMKMDKMKMDKMKKEKMDKMKMDKMDKKMKMKKDSTSKMAPKM